MVKEAQENQKSISQKETESEYYENQIARLTSKIEE